MPKYYESDVTKMIRSLIAEKPHIADEQKQGRALWWDKPADQDERQRHRESRVAQQPYVYQTKV